MKPLMATLFKMYTDIQVPLSNLLNWPNEIKSSNVKTFEAELSEHND